MNRLYIFADEAGCFTFDPKLNVSRFFILCTVTMIDCSVATALLELRRSLAWEGMRLGDYFHASTDQQSVRDRVFELLSKYDFDIQVTVAEKSKARPNLRMSQVTFYEHVWFYHFKYAFSARLNTDAETLITAASLGQRKERAVFRRAIDGVMEKFLPPGQWKTDFWPAGSDPCLQVADYCAWAIQRKYERNDSRSFDLIRDKINYNYNLFYGKSL